MAFNDDNFLDDYEIQELIERFENQLESGMPLFFDADELNIILEHYVQKNDIPKINIIADLASTYHTTNPLTNLIMAKKYLSVQDAPNALPYLKDECNNTEDADYQLSLAYCYSLLDEHQNSLTAYKKAIKLLNSAKNPLILLGGGALNSVEQVKFLTKRTNIPVISTLMG